MKKVDIPVTLFIKNREKLSHVLKNKSLAILHAHDEMNRSADQFFPYRQDSDLFYLCGINQEKTILLLDPDNPDENFREVLFILKPNHKLETWEGHKLTVEEARTISGIKTIKYLNEFESILASMMILAEHVYLNLPENNKFIPEVPCRNLRNANMLRKQYPAHQYERLSPIMHNLRVIKSEEEISLVREACHITHEAFNRVLKTVKPGIAEYEVEAEITYEFLRLGARGHAYAPIVASGANACTLHYVSNDCFCADGDLLLLDFGSEYGNYAADCSRTIPVNGRFSPRQRELYKTVLEVFRFACTLMKPGNSIHKIHNEVCKRFGQEHVKLGLYTDEALKGQNPDNPLFQEYYMHGTSHFLGLDVHDVGSKEMELRPGMILTCEPGIYIPAEKTGIRLENNILITRDGHEDLMKEIPIEPEEIEAMMNKNN
jgi:Xaa-Pro aminopeptidase